jgi:signal peptidase II
LDFDLELDQDPRVSDRSPSAGAATHRVTAILIIVATVALDQASKALARGLLEGRGRLSFLGDVFRLQLAQNAGAFLSLGANLPPGVRGAVLTWGVLALAAGAAFVALRHRGSLAVSAGAALVAGGGFGNLRDRLAANGIVTDFMNLGLGTLRTGIFNVADLAIVAGVVLLVLPHGSAGTRAGTDRE